MKCYVYSVVDSYRLDDLDAHLTQELSRQRYDDVIHIRIPHDGGELCVFQYGVVVFWSTPEDRHSTYLQLLEGFSSQKSLLTEEDVFAFNYGPLAAVKKNEILLPQDTPLMKLSASHAIAQSTKLAIFEQTLANTIAETEHIPKELAETGSQPLSALEIRKKLGKLHIDRSSINLHFELLDEPEFFWDHEEGEPLYRVTRQYLDIDDRLAILNQKLEVVKELFQMLSDELKHQHSSRLEWIIIWLILIEVLITFTKDVFHIL